MWDTTHTNTHAHSTLFNYYNLLGHEIHSIRALLNWVLLINGDTGQTQMIPAGTLSYSHISWPKFYETQSQTIIRLMILHVHLKSTSKGQRSVSGRWGLWDRDQAQLVDDNEKKVKSVALSTLQLYIFIRKKRICIKKSVIKSVNKEIGRFLAAHISSIAQCKCCAMPFVCRISTLQLLTNVWQTVTTCFLNPFRRQPL